jgi:hypothetical protein
LTAKELCTINIPLPAIYALTYGLQSLCFGSFEQEHLEVVAIALIYMNQKMPSTLTTWNVSSEKVILSKPTPVF